MYTRRFFSTQLGLAAMASITLMVAFNVIALSQQVHAQPLPLAAMLQTVELA